MTELTCNQIGCDNKAAFLFTWPGKDQAGICAEHAPKLKRVAEAIGLHAQLIQIEEGPDHD